MSDADQTMDNFCRVLLRTLPRETPKEGLHAS